MTFFSNDEKQRWRNVIVSAIGIFILYQIRNNTDKDTSLINLTIIFTNICMMIEVLNIHHWFRRKNNESRVRLTKEAIQKQNEEWTNLSYPERLNIKKQREEYIIAVKIELIANKLMRVGSMFNGNYEEITEEDVKIFKEVLIENKYLTIEEKLIYELIDEMSFVFTKEELAGMDPEIKLNIHIMNIVTTKDLEKFIQNDLEKVLKNIYPNF